MYVSLNIASNELAIRSTQVFKYIAWVAKRGILAYFYVASKV
jgi:hypothetical protein